METAHRQPKEAGEQCLALVMGMVSDMLINGESAIRLLNGASGDRLSTHTVNVTVVSILLGKAMGLSQQQLVDLGMAAFLHDIGKTVLPDRMRWMEDSFTSAEIRLYQEHVAKGVVLCKPMELPPEVIAAIAQHHELADGSGFPLKVKAGNITPAARILALVNRYDNLCNPSKPSMALTPHEALAKIYAQSKSQFDTLSLSAFIRMMGIYPPGSVVQLNDDRHALVVSVNTARPLKPSVIVHEPGVERHEALVVNLESNSNLGIRKSLRPSQLPSAAIDSLDPGQRVSYYFEPSAFGELQ
jgi:putative nucleotidyltransferase with HDIG domain